MWPEILNNLKTTQMAHVATCENSQPRLRPMTLIRKDERLYLATGATDAKCAQIAANPEVELCLTYKQDPYTGYLRLRGRLVQVDDIDHRKEVADHATFIYDYWQDAADPNYRLYELQLRQFRYMKPGAMNEEVKEL